MSGSIPASAVPSAIRAELRPRKSNLARAVLVFRRRKIALVGLIIIAIFTLSAILADVLAPYDPSAVELGQRFLGPGVEHWFGTDNLGRDILSRVIAGSRISFQVGVLTVALSMLIGVPAGLIAGYVRGPVDSVIMRLVDVFLAFPVIILAIAIVAVRGPGLINVMLALVFVYWTTYARVMRGVTLVLREEDYVLAARSIGVSSLRIMFRHILPNALSPILVIASLGLGNAILSEAALSFLGLGIQPPLASWGSMLNFGMQFLRDEPHISIFPGMAIFITVLGFNLLGDGLRDALDPRLRQ
jgi:peptide/nickel transport system permease protein